MVKLEDLPVKDLKGVYERDVEKLLESLSLLEDFRAGRVTCLVCAKPVTKDNFGGLMRQDGEVRLFCKSDLPKVLENA